MEITPEQYIQIEQYLDGKMTKEEETAFEMALKNNPVLFEQYCFETDLRDNLAEMDFKKKFSAIELDKTMLSNEAAKLKNLFRQNEGESVNENKTAITPAGKVISFRKWIQIAAAASVIMLLISLLWINSNKPQSSLADTKTKVPTLKMDSSNSITKQPEIKITEKTAQWFSDVFDDFFEQDDVPKNKPMLLASNLEDFKKRDYRGIQQFDADNPPTTRDISNDDLLNSEQTYKELGHYYKGLSYISTNNLKLAKQNLQWVIEKATDRKMVVKAQWYLALTYLKENNTDKTISILNQLEGNTKAAPYNLKAKELLNQLK